MGMDVASRLHFKQQANHAASRFQQALLHAYMEHRRTRVAESAELERTPPKRSARTDGEGAPRTSAYADLFRGFYAWD